MGIFEDAQAKVGQAAQDRNLVAQQQQSAINEFVQGKAKLGIKPCPIDLKYLRYDKRGKYTYADEVRSHVEEVGVQVLGWRVHNYSPDVIVTPDGQLMSIFQSEPIRPKKHLFKTAESTPPYVLNFIKLPYDYKPPSQYFPAVDRLTENLRDTLAWDIKHMQK